LAQCEIGDSDFVGDEWSVDGRLGVLERFEEGKKGCRWTEEDWFFCRMGEKLSLGFAGESAGFARGLWKSVVERRSVFATILGI
jgi:hypothetical protein